MIWEEEQVPTDWEEGCLIKIPKKDLSKCENYIDTTLLPVPGNFFNSPAESNKRCSRRPTSRSTSWIRKDQSCTEGSSLNNQLDEPGHYTSTSLVTRKH
ncbi:unnamed protein product [Schistosoma curassoni]|uniref:Ovule protein n=1 Tax=Schistosoma curassoni TaxID=6186 RepID=A0A183KDH8_9TREM|nr:unnamed protein product [Schistosoma curassoni]